MLKYDQLQEVAVCLSGVPQTIEDIADDANLTVAAAQECMAELRRRGVSICKDNSLRAKAKTSAAVLHGICATWKPRG